MAETTPQLAVNRPNVRTVTGWTIFFMVLLRLAIGWHFFYEGAWKLAQDSWSAAPYLIQSTGPLRPFFRGMVKDIDGFERLTAESIHQRIDNRYDQLVKHYQLTDEDNLPDRQAYHDQADAIVNDPDFQNQLADYKKFVEQNDALVKTSAKPDYNTERLVYDYGKKASMRQALLARIEGPLAALDNDLRGAAIAKTVGGEGAVREMPAGPPPPRTPSQTPMIDWSNMIALTAVGVCLMLGLFTRLAALGGVGLLMMYYFAMPPWPGLPTSPLETGHYLFINQNVIEAIALVMIATSGAGRWAGLDAYLGACCRRRCACGTAAPAAQPSANA